MAVTTPRPDTQAFQEAMTLPFPDVVKRLQALLDERVIAFIGGVHDNRRVREWASGLRHPRPGVEERLRVTLQVGTAIAGASDGRVAQAWLLGLNPELDDRQPAQVLRDEDLARNGRDVVAAARIFVTGG
ncbi:MAG TPA: hypothetical protein VMW62_18660 [Chloroflexota bacterium]|nr:hypothetical protein [Chloroflexota bacterium]